MWKKRRKPEHITVDLDGLGKLIHDLDGLWASDISHGPSMRIRPHNYEEGWFVVTIGPDYANKLRGVVRSYEFSDVYGPRARPRVGGGAPDGTE